MSSLSYMGLLLEQNKRDETLGNAPLQDKMANTKEKTLYSDQYLKYKSKFMVVFYEVVVFTQIMCLGIMPGATILFCTFVMFNVMYITSMMLMMEQKKWFGAFFNRKQRIYTMLMAASFYLTGYFFLVEKNVLFTILFAVIYSLIAGIFSFLYLTPDKTAQKGNRGYKFIWFIFASLFMMYILLQLRALYIKLGELPKF